IAVKIGVAVATMEPTILTYVGTTPIVTGKVTEAIVGAGGTKSSATVGNLIIKNDVDTKGEVLTLGVSAGAISVGTNVLVVSNDTLARAGIFGKDVTVTGATTIDAGFSAKSDTQLLAVNAGAIAVGVNVFVANLTADNRAVVDTTGATVTTGSLAAYAGRSNNVNVTQAKATGIGSTTAAIAVTVNVAYADNATVNNAEVLGTGKLAVTGGALTVEANGRATAESRMGAGVVTVSGAEVVSNNSFAYLDATQEAKLENATITTNGGAVRIASNFNVPTTSGSDVTNYGAVSKIGVNGGGKVEEGEAVRITLIGIKVSVGKARMDATVRAIADNVTLDTSRTSGSGARGAVDVLVNAHSYAIADTLAPTVNIALVDVGVADTRSEAKGTFEASLGLRGTNKTGATMVSTGYDSYSFAANGPLGGLSVSVISSVTNVARSTTGTTAKAGLTGTGTLDVTGSLNIIATGGSNAETQGRTPKVDISGFKIAVNDVKATQGVTQEAFSTFAGTLTASGLINVTSTLGTRNNPIDATATVGSSAGASISLLGVTVNTAVADSSSTNNAYVTGPGSASTKYEAGNITVSASTFAKSHAYAKTALAVSLATNGDLDARAYSTDEVHSYASGLTLDATQDVTISSYANADVIASVETKGAVTGTAISVLRSYADMGTENKAQTVDASIDESTVVIAGRDVTLTAKNYGNVEGKVDGGSTISIIGTIDAKFGTYANFKTEIGVGDGAKVKAGGNVLMSADSKPMLTSNAKASSLGIIVSTANTYANSTARLETNATVGEGAEIAADGGVSIFAGASMGQSSISSADSKGFVGQDALKSELTINRVVTTTIGAGSQISADFGTVDTDTILDRDLQCFEQRNDLFICLFFKNDRTFITVDRKDIDRAQVVF
ncbi:MAG: hypothetical protein IJH42_02600, partial [Atopobiaceae bacterium]|nr:hypothetical protein [Atopobiaceae bacterium]